jgi:PAS domain S-box-containing protein
MESKRIKILAIDDNKDNLISISALIAETFPDAKVFVAMTGQEGLEIAAIEDPDVILLDIVMPYMDGFEVCRNLKANKKLADIPIVFITAIKSERENRISALECGAEAFLSKPIDEYELTAQIRAMVKIKTASIEKKLENERLSALVEEQTHELIVTNQAAINLLEDIRKENDARKKSEEALRRNEAILEKMVTNISDVIVIIDQNGINRYNSPNLEKLFGWKSEELTGTSTWENIHPEELETMQNFFTHLLCTDNAKGTESCRYRCKDDSFKWIEVSMINLLSDSVIHGVLGNYHDITDRKNSDFLLRAMNEELIKTNEELMVAKERAEESDRLKSAFLANMSHEIRTPMNGILGFAGLLKEPKLSGEEQHEYISIIERSGARMLNIINDIVDISKIESGQMKITVSETNINDQIEYICVFLRPEVERKGMQLLSHCSLTAKEAIIKTDREKVYSILTNLVKNAVKYCDKGSIEVGYNLKNTTDEIGNNAEVEFYVKDTGIGIPLDRQKAIFDRFVQADISDRRAFQGAGLGLAISKAYVEMLGGKIWVESHEDVGSAFYFTLPYICDYCEKKDVKNIKMDDVGENKINPEVLGLKILIAEDDETSGMLIELIVKALGREIFKASTGVEAVETCRNNPDLDLILMDIKMPEIDGYEAARQIREFNSNVIIIAQTAYALIGDRERALAAGCNEYIAKPFDRATLVALIKTLWMERQSKN